MKKYWWLILLLLVSSCAAPSTMMVNPETRQIANCQTMGWGLLGLATAVTAHDNCVSSFRSAGWVPANEYQEAPK